MENRTEVTQFILLGLTNDPGLQVPLFISFLLIYTITLFGNLGMTLLILLDSCLHTPMYFFLGNLSLATQSFPTMTHVFLNVIGSYICGFLNASIHTVDTFSLSFCESNVVHHFFCDVPEVMVLSCSDRHVSELVLIYAASFNSFFAFIVFGTTYVFIFIMILKMQSAAGYQQAISTCASHFTAVSIFYGTVIFMYPQPNSNHSMDTDQIASVFYTMVIPMLNPLVYSLRNKDIKNTFRKFY
uniref:G-protein coupled receptors family 1 profile domain-containing protein n=1 Tax=Nannospalax galili TaxID=1026970 RepID=A0A8C6R196_NANGA